MSDILKALCEHLRPIVPMVEYYECYEVPRSQLRPDDPNWCDDDQPYNQGPSVEVLYPQPVPGQSHPDFAVGALLQMDVDGLGFVIVERNSYSGLSYGVLQVDPADPRSFDMVGEFLSSDPSNQ